MTLLFKPAWVEDIVVTTVVGYSFAQVRTPLPLEMRFARTLLLAILAAAGGDSALLVSASSENGATEPNDCDGIEIGSLSFWLVSSADPEEVGLFPFSDLPGNLSLYLTGSSWNGTEFEGDEGTIEYVTPASGIPAGQSFGYGPSSTQEWTPIEGEFALGAEEGVFLYCVGSDSTQRPLTAIAYDGEGSALPAELAAKDGAIVLPSGRDRYFYVGPKESMRPDELKAAMMDADNWTGGAGSSGFSAKPRSAAALAAAGVAIWILSSLA